MRIAPIPLFAVVNNMSIEDAGHLTDEAVAITHHHPLGIIPAVMMSYIIYRLMQDEFPSRATLEGHINESMESVRVMYPEDKRYLDTMSNLVDLTLSLVDNDQSDVSNIKHTGGGWVAEETLAIALYCSLRYFDDFEHAVIAAVNHAGDSDSTGAVVGNILGTAVGYNAIPQYFKDDLELVDVIIKLANMIV